jgi:hypothetical protein
LLTLTPQNISYARSLLTRLEQEALAVKIHARRQEAQADLVRKREVLEQLSERLSDLAEFAAAGNNGSGIAEEDTSDGEDILADIVMTPSESLDSTRSLDTHPGEPDDERPDRAPEPVEPPPPQDATTANTSEPESQPSPSTAAHTATTATSPATGAVTSTAPTAITTTPTTATSQNLRSRQPNPTQPQVQATATTTATAPSSTSSRSTLFANRPTTSTITTTALSSSSNPAPAIPTTTEAILDHHRAEQDALSESILKLASELKASSHAFSASLEEDRALVDRAGRGMAQAGERMEAVTRRMGLLQRMTEGEGWWGRVKLYALVYGLMVVLVLLVGVGPKLRF